MIENIKKIDFNLSEFINNFRNTKHDKELFIILLSLFDFQDNNNNNINRPSIFQRLRSYSISDINKYKIDENYKDNIGSKITSLCQYKNGIAIGDVKGKVHCYSLMKKKLSLSLIITEGKGKEIKYLYSLKNGNFICSLDNLFKIYNINDKKYTIIQTFKYANEENQIQQPENNKNNKKNVNNNKNNKRYYQILELLNKNLLYIDRNKLIILTNLTKDNYKEKPIKELTLGSNIIYMTELNENKFSIYCEDKKLIILDSNNYSQKSWVRPNLILKKIEGIDSDKIALLSDRKLCLFSEAKQDLIGNESIDNAIDVCTDFDKMLVAFKDSIIQYEVKVNERGKYLTKLGQIKMNKINCIYLLKYIENNINNGDIICVYDEGKIKVFKKL